MAFVETDTTTSATGYVIVVMLFTPHTSCHMLIIVIIRPCVSLRKNTNLHTGVRTTFDVGINMVSLYWVLFIRDCERCR